MSGPVIVTVSTVSNFDAVWNDEGSGADMDGAFWRPLIGAKEDFFLLGDLCVGNYNDPTGTVLVIAVSNDDKQNPALKKPESFNEVWNDKGSGADKNGSVWAAVAPTGYVAIGMVANKGHGKPPVIDRYRCLRSDLAKKAEFGPLIWWDKGSHADQDVAVYSIAGTGLYYAQGNFNDPSGTAWVPKVFDQTS